MLTIRTLSDGKILIGGKFPSMGTDVRIARLNADGSIDTTMTTRPRFDIFIGMVKVEPVANGKILACGPFRDANGVAKYGLARFNYDGTLDDTYTTVLTGGSGLDPTCYDIKTLPGGKILITGFFSAIDGVTKNGAARLNADGTFDSSYTVQPLGANIFLGQNGQLFFSYVSNYSDPNFPLEIFFNSGFSRNDPASGNSVGSYRCIYRKNREPTRPVPYGLIDGRTMVTGDCDNPLTNSNYQFSRIKQDYTFDSTLDRIDFGQFGNVTNIARQPDGKFILLGNFASVNGVTRRNTVRLQPKTVPTSVPGFDFDGDRKADFAVFRPSDRYWYIYKSTGGYTYIPWGLSTDKPISADYDNDGKADIAVFRDGTWYIIRSSDGTWDVRTFGGSGDTPLVGNFTSDDPIDDRVDMVVRSPFTSGSSNVRWQFRNFGQTSTASGILPAEATTDKAVVADLDGDSIDEYGFFRDGVWKTLARGGTTQNIRQFQWGSAGDIPVAADYDGDGQADYAIYRPSTATGGSTEPPPGFTLSILALRPTFRSRPITTATAKQISPSIATANGGNFSVPPTQSP